MVAAKEQPMLTVALFYCSIDEYRQTDGRMDEWMDEWTDGNYLTPYDKKTHTISGGGGGKREHFNFFFFN